LHSLGELHGLAVLLLCWVITVRQVIEVIRVIRFIRVIRMVRLIQMLDDMIIIKVIGNISIVMVFGLLDF
jgi:hypothetical protein